MALAATLRAHGQPWHAIAAALRHDYGINGRVAMRLAHGWVQAEAATRWNDRWPDDPKTFKNFSYWETWPAETGYAPSLGVLDRLAQLYECDVVDLLAGVGTHRADDPHADSGGDRSGAAMFRWQMLNLDLAELTRSIRALGSALPEHVRRANLLKLSAAAAAAAPPDPGPRRGHGRTPNVRELAGAWNSRYTYASTGRGCELTGQHHIDLRAEAGRLVGRSVETSTGAVALDLSVDGLLVAGSWSERTSPAGYYRGAVYHGTLQLVLDPTGRSMTGKWLGPDKTFRVDSGDWTLTRALPETDPDPTSLVHTSP